MDPSSAGVPATSPPHYAAPPLTARKADDDPAKPPARKKRRVFSCQACQKVKCRCEYEASSQACRRCQNLRISCSLAGEGVRHVAPEKTASPTAIGSVEERLRQHDVSLREIKDLLQQVLVQSRREPVEGGSSPSHAAATTTSPQARRSQADPSAAASAASAAEDDSLETLGNPEHISDPADQDTSGAPVVVMRGLESALDGGRRRLQQQEGLDVVQTGVLDEATAGALFGLFLRHAGRHMLLVHDVDDVATSTAALRRTSPFLFSAGCLMGFRYAAGQPAMRPEVNNRVYESLRLALGQVALVTPLPLSEVNAMLLMAFCGGAPVPAAGTGTGTAVGAAVEYIDSWVLTGYCVQHAMLSIHFAAIVDHVKRGCATRDDYRALRLWCYICLTHLQWAAMTGRPSVIAPPYLRQCTALLNIYHATLQDGTMVAATLLYAMLHRKLTARGGDGDTGDTGGDSFSSWKEKWLHLFDLPQASLLKLNYYAARFIYAIRSPPTAAGASASAKAGAGDDAGPTPESQTTETGPAAEGYRYAVRMVQAYLDLDDARVEEVHTHMMMSVAYAALMIAHHHDAAGLSVAAARTLLDALSRRCLKSSNNMALARKTILDAKCVVDRESAAAAAAAATTAKETAANPEMLGGSSNSSSTTLFDPSTSAPAYYPRFPGEGFYSADTHLPDTDVGALLAGMGTFFAAGYM